MASTPRAPVSPVPMTFVVAVHDALVEKNIAVNKKDLKPICDTIIETLIEKLVKGENVKFANRMSFKRVLRAERTHKRPLKSTDDSSIVYPPIVKPAHFVIKMDVMAMLKKQFEELDVTAASAEKPVKKVKKAKSSDVEESSDEGESNDTVMDEEVVFKPKSRFAKKADDKPSPKVKAVKAVKPDTSDNEPEEKVVAPGKLLEIEMDDEVEVPAPKKTAAKKPVNKKK